MPKQQFVPLDGDHVVNGVLFTPEDLQRWLEEEGISCDRVIINRVFSRDDQFHVRFELVLPGMINRTGTASFNTDLL